MSYLKSISKKQVLMTTRKYSIFFMAIALISILASAYMVLKMDREPLYKKELITVLDYDHVGRYDYEAGLNYNTLYNNKTKYTRIDGPLFINILKNMTIYFDYHLIGDGKLIPHSKSYDLELWLRSEDAFNIKIPEDIISDLFIIQKSSSIIVFFNSSNMLDYYEKISEETETNLNSYELIINTKVSMNANYQDNEISEHFSHELPVILTSTGLEGNQVTFGNLTKTIDKDIKKEVEVEIEVDKTTRSYFIVLYFLSAILLATIGYIHHKIPYVKPEKSKIEEIIEQNKQILIKSDAYIIEDKNIVPMEDIEELIKLSDYIMKPILYYVKEDKATFYITDESTIYQFDVTEKNENANNTRIK